MKTGKVTLCTSNNVNTHFDADLSEFEKLLEGFHAAKDSDFVTFNIISKTQTDGVFVVRKKDVYALSWIKGQ
jgi:hypothetical protein